jgi:hypothetical protein
MNDSERLHLEVEMMDIASRWQATVPKHWG